MAEEEQNKALVDKPDALAKQNGCTMVGLSLVWLSREGYVLILSPVSEKGSRKLLTLLMLRDNCLTTGIHKMFILGHFGLTLVVLRL